MVLFVGPHVPELLLLTVRVLFCVFEDRVYTWLCGVAECLVNILAVRVVGEIINRIFCRYDLSFFSENIECIARTLSILLSPGHTMISLTR